MSAHTSIKRNTIRHLQECKGVRPIVSLTAYTAPMAALLDDYCDMLLVGDSLGMVLYGMDSTLPVTLDDMIRHAQAVMRASRKACVIVDMPFGSVQTSREQAYDNAVKVMKATGAAGIKLEGGAEMAETISFLQQRAIPVMAHIGLKPQHVHVMGGYRIQGRGETQAKKVMEDAQAVTDAGAFALLLEGLEATTAAHVTQNVAIPTIGIGAGVGCDGQILVTEDMLGLNAHVPKFVRQYGTMRDMILNATQAYANDVRNKTFPDDSTSY